MGIFLPQAWEGSGGFLPLPEEAETPLGGSVSALPVLIWMVCETRRYGRIRKMASAVCGIHIRKRNMTEKTSTALEVPGIIFRNPFRSLPLPHPSEKFFLQIALQKVRIPSLCFRKYPAKSFHISRGGAEETKQVRKFMDKYVFVST